MLKIIMILIMLAMIFSVLRCIRAETIYDRILAANVFSTQTVALIAILAFISDNMIFLDIALIYAMINFITTLAFLKYFKRGSAK